MRTKEQQITFQNQSHLIQKHFNDCGICPTLLDVALATELMVLFATEGYSKELKKRFDDFEVYIEKEYKNEKV